jgi:hypothetical protein
MQTRSGCRWTSIWPSTSEQSPFPLFSSLSACSTPPRHLTPTPACGLCHLANLQRVFPFSSTTSNVCPPTSSHIPFFAQSSLMSSSALF